MKPGYMANGESGPLFVCKGFAERQRDYQTAEREERKRRKRSNALRSNATPKRSPR